MIVSRVQTIRNSLFTQILVVSLGGFVGFFLFVFVLFQTTLIFSIFPGALSDAAGPLSEIVRIAESASAESEAGTLAAFSDARSAALIREAFPPGSEQHIGMKNRILSRDIDVAAAFEGREMRFRRISSRGFFGHASDHANSTVNVLAGLEVSIELRDGRVLSALYSPASFFAGEPRGFFALLLFATFLITAVSAVLINQALKPLRILEHATKLYDQPGQFKMIKESGAEEIRRVTRALNASQERIKELMEERSRIVSAIAHDIRTSITKLRLRLEQPTELSRDDVFRDLDQMQRLIEDMQTYAQSNRTETRLEIVELFNFIQGYSENTPNLASANVLNEKNSFRIAADPVALTRVLDNLVDNAIRYGGETTICYGETDLGFEIRIQDDGSGISEEHLEQVFEPFFRIESSRSKDTGGSGLGLGIARALIAAQGGDLDLSNRRTGGLCATIVFPISCRLE